MEVLPPSGYYASTGLPITVLKRGESEGLEHVVPNPGVIEDRGRVILFQSQARSGIIKTFGSIEGNSEEPSRLL